MADALRFAYDTRAVRTVFGAGTLATLPAELDACGLGRVILITTPGRAAMRASVESLLGKRLAGAFTEARQHVPAGTVQAALAVTRQGHAESVVTLGGGSAIGLGKAIALDNGLPIAAIPTTYSGSEMTAIWGLTEGSEKRTGRNPRVAPRLVLYDPELTYDLPAKVSAASGMNAVAHAVEAAYAPDASPVSSLLAWDAIRRLSDSLPVIAREPRDPDARAEALAGAHLAGRALDMTSMGLHHKLAHVLGGSFGLPHAEAHAALLACVVAYNAPAAPEAMARIAAALRTDDAVAGLADLARQLGTPTLAGLGFTKKQIPKAAALAAAGGYPNPRPVTEDGVREVLENALSA